MKKISIFFIAFLLTLLSSCNHGNKLYDIEYQSYLYDLIEFKTEKNVYTMDDTVIKYSIKNISNEEVAINSDDNCFDLQMLKDGEWKRVGTRVEHSWTEAALIIEPDQIVEREINLEDYYYIPLLAGTYRICVENTLSDTFEIKYLNIDKLP